MNKLYLPSVTLLCSFFIFPSQNVMAQGKGDKAEPSTVEYVDLNRYAGLWYEIAKIPNRFQKQCARNTTAAYALNDDGTIQVINQCTKNDGSVDRAEGKARIVDTTSNAKLEVSFVSIFGFHLFWGDYWVIGLDENYRYAVVGTPTRKYGWILCREKQMPEDLFKEAKAILTGQGYNPDDFVMTVQD
ncbi:MAG: lipocalin family protein [Calditrichaceae bacterium]|jgi:apolipoprotein D and lipocalin family protein